MPDVGAGEPDDVRSLRRGMRDLVALSTLPAVWGDFGPDQLAESLADVLVGMVDLDLLLVRVPLSLRQPPYDAVRTRTDGPYTSEQVRTIAEMLPVDLGGTRTHSLAVGGGALSMVTVPLKTDTVGEFAGPSDLWSATSPTIPGGATGPLKSPSLDL